MLILRTARFAGIAMAGLVCAFNVYADDVPPALYNGAAAWASSANVITALVPKVDSRVTNSEIAQFSFALYGNGLTVDDKGLLQKQTDVIPDLDIFNKHQQFYCSPNIVFDSKAEFDCSPLKSGLSMADSKLAELSDVRFSVLIEPTAYTMVAAIFAQNLIRTLVSPFPTTKYVEYANGEKKIDQDASAKSEYARFLAANAKLGAAFYSLNEMYFIRLRGNQLGVTTGDATNKSLLETIEHEASRRFVDPNFAVYLVHPTTDEKAILREMAMMQAFSLWMQYQAYRQNERIEGILAIMLAQQANDAIAKALESSSKKVPDSAPTPSISSMMGG